MKLLCLTPCCRLYVFFYWSWYNETPLSHPLPACLLIDGEEWNLCLHLAEGGGGSCCCYISAHRLRGLPTLYPSPAIKGHSRGDGVSFCASQFCLEKCFFIYLYIYIYIYIYIFPICLAVRPLPALSMYCRSLGFVFEGWRPSCLELKTSTSSPFGCAPRALPNTHCVVHVSRHTHARSRLETLCILCVLGAQTGSQLH